MRLWVIGLLTLVFLVGCSDSETTKETLKVEDNETEEVVVEEVTSEPQEETTDTTPVEEVEEEEVASIDTSVFAYAESVDVTDARDITKHIDLVVNMSTDPTPGLAVQHVVSQTYRFLQQEDITGADTITIGVMQDGTRTAQYTVEVSKFIPVPDKSMVKCVLEASTIDKMNDEVKEFGAAMELW
jgi:PBP1b-binding outer membrane lipoprotein LpoB